jgi:hypothetical protein
MNDKRLRTDVATTRLTALTQQEIPDAAIVVATPFKEFCTTIDAPRTNEFTLVQVDCFEVLTHKKKEEENKKCGRPEPTAREKEQQATTQRLRDEQQQSGLKFKHRSGRPMNSFQSLTTASLMFLNCSDST